MYRCRMCHRLWDDERALDNELSCTKRCNGRLGLVPPLGAVELAGLDLNGLPYPVALTARRLDRGAARIDRRAQDAVPAQGYL